jgi:hypothetical protein
MKALFGRLGLPKSTLGSISAFACLKALADNVAQPPG